MESEAIFERALELHEDCLSSLPNVVGLGIVDNPHGDGLAVAVYVSKKVPQEMLKLSERIPQHLVLEWKQTERRVPVAIIEIGVVQPQSTG